MGGYLVMVPLVTHIVIGIILEVEVCEQGSPYFDTPKYQKSKMINS
jgi:hypothetical protein